MAAAASHSNLYVTGFPVHFTSKQLEHLFSSFGPIRSVKVVNTTSTSESSPRPSTSDKGVGFVRFERVNDALNALQAMNGQVISPAYVASLQAVRSPLGSTSTSATSASLVDNENDSDASPLSLTSSSDELSVSSHTLSVRLAYHNSGPLSQSQTSPHQPSRSLHSQHHFSPSSPHASHADSSLSPSSQSTPGFSDDASHPHVYVAGLPERYSAYDLQHLCEPFGVCTAKVLLDPHTSRSRLCGFVRFENVEDAQRFITAVDQTVLEDSSRPIQARFAARKNTSPREPVPTLSSHGLQRRDSRSAGDSPSQQERVMFHQSATSPYPMSVMPFLPLPMHMQWMPQMPFDISTFPTMMEQGISQHDAEQMNQMAMGFPFHTFSLPTQDWYPMSQYSPNTPFLSPPPDMLNIPMSTLNHSGHEAPISMGYLNEQWALFVSLLPAHFNDDHLVQLGSSCGVVTQAHVLRTQDGESRLCGFICYSTEEEGMQAIATMNGLVVDGNPIKVAWKKPSTHSSPRHANLRAVTVNSAASTSPSMSSTHVRTPSPSESGSDGSTSSNYFVEPPSPATHLLSQQPVDV